MSTLVVEPEPPIAQRIREARERLDAFLVIVSVCTTETSHRLAEEGAEWSRGDIADLEGERLSSLRELKHPRDTTPPRARIDDSELDPPTRKNGEGPWVIRDALDDRYIGREPNGNTPAILCWPTKLNRHVMHFPTKEAAQTYIANRGDPSTRRPRYVRVRPKGDWLR